MWVSELVGGFWKEEETVKGIRVVKKNKKVLKKMKIRKCLMEWRERLRNSPCLSKITAQNNSLM